MMLLAQCFLNRCRSRNIVCNADPGQAGLRTFYGIVSSYTYADWVQDIELAKASGIDGFALNSGTDPWTDRQLVLAYSAAVDVGNFSMFISFDFIASPGFKDYKENVIPRLRAFAKHSGAAQYGEGALVSTFGGDGFDWTPIKAAVNDVNLTVIPFYQPDGLRNVGIDGAFSWSAWPNDANRPVRRRMSTVRDRLYMEALEGKPYMAPVSPWFFTHYGRDTWNKNWFYNSDTLFVDRWKQILELKPQLIEIISWNDFGESHYIGPLHPEKPDVYAGGPNGAQRWVTDMPHDGWRALMAPYIAAYKHDTDVVSEVKEEAIVYWHRPFPKQAVTSDPVPKPDGYNMSLDNVWAATILKEPAELTINIGNASYTNLMPVGVAYYGAPMGKGGRPSFKLTRNGSILLEGTGPLDISKTGQTVNNFNALVGHITTSIQRSDAKDAIA